MPAHRAFLATVFGSAVLAAHAMVALALPGATASALVRAVAARGATGFAGTGPAAILAAGIAGASCVASGSNSALLAMALATAAAMFCYLAAVFSLR